MSMLKSSQEFKHLNSVDLFMIDLIMMLEAKWLFQWGISKVHDLINHYLRRQTTPKKITYKDNRICN